MAAYIYDDKVLIYCFQDSLTGAALNWYVSLERGHIKTWRDLAKAFLKQYKYIEDMAPDRSQLRNMVKREQEGYMEYAQRWRELAAQVQPPITKREMVVGNVASNFANLMVPASEKKKGKTNAILVEPVFPQAKVNTSTYSTWIQVGSKSTATPPAPYILPCQPRADVGAATNTRPVPQGTRRPHRVLAPIPMTYTELFPLLLEQKLVEVQDLLDGGLRGFKDKGPNVHSNPLQAHEDVVINAISHKNGEKVESPDRRREEDEEVECAMGLAN
ncbi:hypothetical protein CR513_44177, partial [Mucuna pruriens]